jgi:hypothetical protein
VLAHLVQVLAQAAEQVLAQGRTGELHVPPSSFAIRPSSKVTLRAENACCKSMFQVFQMFRLDVASVSLQESEEPCFITVPQELGSFESFMHLYNGRICMLMNLLMVKTRRRKRITGRHFLNKHALGKLSRTRAVSPCQRNRAQFHLAILFVFGVALDNRVTIR